MTIIKPVMLEKTPPVSAAPARLALQHPRELLLCALALGWCVDWFFFAKPIGVSLTLFAGLSLAALVLVGRWEGQRPLRGNLWLLVPLFFFAVMAFIRANTFLTVLNTLAVLALLSYLAFFYTSGRVSQLGLLGLLLVPVRTLGHSVGVVPPLLTENVSGSGLTGYRRHVRPLLRGLLLALPVLLIFGTLLAAADLVFASYIEELLQWEMLANLDQWIGRFLKILGVAWVMAGAMAYALLRRRHQATQGRLEEFAASLQRQVPLGFTESMTILTSVTLLFLVFVVVQFTYLFGGRRLLAERDFTYAEYARRGFFELVTVAILTLALVLFLNWLSRRENKRQLRLFKAISSGLIMLVLVLLLSAWRRMQLYESAFGYTELRLIVTVFMFWLGIVLLWFMVTMWTRPYLFTSGVLLAAMGFLATLNLHNPDALIVRSNLARYAETGYLDAAYLVSLSPDAVPGLIAALPQVMGDGQLVPVPGCASWSRSVQGDYHQAGCTATPAKIISINLTARHQAMETDTSWREWPSFHLARLRSYHLLGNLR